MWGKRWRLGSIGVRARIVVASVITAAGAGCGSGGSSGSSQGVVGGGGSGGQAGGTCDSPAPMSDLCASVPTGTLTSCGQDSTGQPSQTGYLEIQSPDGSKTYVCATAWTPGGSGGYSFAHPDQFMSDPQSCCGGAATPVAAPSAPKPAGGDMGSPHPPRDIKPQESAQPGNGPLRQDPFAVAVVDSKSAAAFQAALANWNAWAGDGMAHPAPDGSGAYYFPKFVLINYVIIQTRDGTPVIVMGPEVSSTADGQSPLGHPTLGTCAAGGGAPLALMAGELAGTTLTNHSGRFGYDASVTQQALDNASKLFSCRGIQVTKTTYYPPKP
jgi:hypothetical protein